MTFMMQLWLFSGQSSFWLSYCLCQIVGKALRSGFENYTINPFENILIYYMASYQHSVVAINLNEGFRPILKNIHLNSLSNNHIRDNAILANNPKLFDFRTNGFITEDVAVFVVTQCKMSPDPMKQAADTLQGS